tara:strand:+ start:65 stop:892 length:828 start_codon:yes stop_codon:yes gene_type:complete
MYLFFGLLWLLNGGDKFFNGEMRHDTDPNIAKYVMLNPETDEVIGRIHGFRVWGLYGVNRDAKFEAYFGQLGLSADVSQFFLYSISIFEIILGLIFLYIFFRTFGRWNHLYDKATLFGTRTLQRLCFKSSILLFWCFVVFDILTGDRFEALEHLLLMSVCLFAYYIFLQQHAIEREEDREIAVAGWNGIERRGLYSGKDRRKSTNEIFNGEERRNKARGRRAEDKTGEAYQPRRVQEYITDNDRRRGEAERRKGPRKKVDPSLKQQFGNEPPIIY